MQWQAHDGLRLLHVVPTYYPAVRYGGPIHSVHGLCKALVAAGHRVDVCTTSVDGSSRLDVPEAVPVSVDGVSVHYFRSRFDRLYWSPSMRRFLHRRGRDHDLIHLHSVFLWPTAAAARMAKEFGIPYVLSPRGMLVPELIAARSAAVKRTWIRWIETRNLSGAARLHVTSDTERLDLERCGLALAPVSVIANGTEVPDTVGRAPIARRVLFLGRLSWKKNLDALVRAVAALPECGLTLAGPDDEGLEPHLSRLASELGIEERVRFVGQADAEQKVRLFVQAACAVLPSINENFGNVVLEAMAHGCPVVVSPGVGSRSVVEASGGGLVASGSDAQSLQVALAALLENPEGAEEMGRRGAEFVRRHYSWAAIAAQMVSMYREVLAHRR
jgi:glycosyltransferase involved in cell wall biosynthesis